MNESTSEIKPPSLFVDYGEDVKQLIYQDLESNVGLKQQFLEERKERQIIGRVIAVVAAAFPLLILSFLAYQLMYQESVISQMGDVSRAVVISASLLCFAIIYTVLVKGMFGDALEKEVPSPTQEAIEIMKEYRGNGG